MEKTCTGHPPQTRFQSRKLLPNGYVALMTDWNLVVTHEPQQVAAWILHFHQHNIPAGVSAINSELCRILVGSVESQTRCPQWSAFAETYLPCVFAELSLESLQAGITIDESGGEMKMRVRHRLLLITGYFG